MRRCFILILLLFPAAAPAQDVTQARKVVVKVNPAYPDLARRLHISGTVKLRATIASNGSVKSVETVGGNPVLVKAAQEAITKWKFAPSPDETQEVVELRFDTR